MMKREFGTNPADLYAAVTDRRRHRVSKRNQTRGIIVEIFGVDIGSAPRKRDIYTAEQMHIQNRDGKLLRKLDCAEHIFGVDAGDIGVYAARVKALINVYRVINSVPLFDIAKSLNVDARELVLRKAHIKLNKFKAELLAELCTFLRVHQFYKCGCAKIHTLLQSAAGGKMLYLVLADLSEDVNLVIMNK